MTIVEPWKMVKTDALYNTNMYVYMVYIGAHSIYMFTFNLTGTIGMFYLEIYNVLYGY